MKQLTVLRHALAAPATPALRDYERPLSPRGEEDAALMGRRLAGAFRLPDLVLASPARRARRTAEIVAAALAYPPTDIRFESGVYEARVSDLFAVLQEVDDGCERVLLVAHNPAATELCTYLLQTWVAGLPAGGYARLELAIESWSELVSGCGRLLAMEHPPGSD